MPIAASRVQAFLPKPVDAVVAALVLWLGAVAPGVSGLPYSEVIYPLLLVACGTALAWGIPCSRCRSLAGSWSSMP